jgi:hypothetical protein
MHKSPDQDVGDWRRENGKKRLRQLIERRVGANRAEARDLAERYEREAGRFDDFEPPPRID